MKENHTKLPKTPNISINGNTISINNKSYTNSILIQKEWLIEPLGITTTYEWLTHPLRRNCPQILSQEAILPLPHIIDPYWEKRIPVEVLKPKEAYELVKLFIAENRDYQLVLYSS